MDEIITSIRKQAANAKRSFDQMEGELESIKTLYREIIDKAEEVIKERENVENIDYDLGKKTVNQLSNPFEKINVFKKIEKPFMDLTEKIQLLQSVNALHSNILTVQQTKNLIYLIDMPISTKWKLIYWASRDGFGAKDFHYHCDYKPNTLTIIKTENGNVFGGFTTAEWDTSGENKEDRNAYLFVLISNKNAPAKFEIVKDTNEAINCLEDYGPVFGRNDLCIANNSNSNEESSSEKLEVFSDVKFSLTDTETFKVKDIEVFQKV